MAEKKSTPVRTPAKTPTGGGQRSIMSFFSKSASSAKAAGATRTPTTESQTSHLQESTTRSNTLLKARHPVDTTPVPSSDALEPPSSQENLDTSTAKKASPALPLVAHGTH